MSAFRVRYTAKENERVPYVDVTSLYPDVKSTFPYPEGHPEIIHRDFEDVGNYFCLIRAVMLPPRGVYFPLLPYKTTAGKLLFTLCHTCTEINHQQGPCAHNERQRALMGVYVTELKKTLQLGYKVERITEVWHFKEKSYTLFTGYIQTFLKGKQKASGYPANAVDEESHQKYSRG